MGAVDDLQAQSVLEMARCSGEVLDNGLPVDVCQSCLRRDSASVIAMRPAVQLVDSDRLAGYCCPNYESTPDVRPCLVDLIRTGTRQGST